MSLTAFIDESGHRTFSSRSSDYFVMSAVIFRARDLSASTTLLRQMREGIRRGPNYPLHWRRIKNHAQRVYLARSIGAADFLTISSVVVCKRSPDPNDWAGWDDPESAYLYTFRVLLERLSWIARDSATVASYMLAHVKRFKIESLRRYEAELRVAETQIAWQALDPKGGQVDQPNRIEQLQLADLAASATALAFQRDEYGNTEPRYLREFASRLYRRGDQAKESRLTSYGLKMYPWTDETRRLHPWVLGL